jgi:hypothetical protein
VKRRDRWVESKREGSPVPGIERCGLASSTSSQGSNVFLNENKHFASIKHRKFLRNVMAHQFLKALSFMKAV